MTGRVRLGVLLALVAGVLASAGVAAAGDRRGLGPLALTDLDLQAGQATVGWSLGGQSDESRRAADVQARRRIGSGDWSAWRSVAAPELRIDGVSPGDLLAAEVRVLDRRGRSIDTASGSFPLPSADGVDAVSCVNDIGRSKVDDGDEQRDRSLSLARRRVAVPAVAGDGVRLTTPSGAVVSIGVPSPPRSRAVRFSAAAVRFGSASAPTVLAVLPAGQANPCAPVPDLSGVLAPALPPELEGAGVDILTVLPDESAPVDFSFPIGVPAGGDVVPLGDGFAIRDASGTPVVGVDPPAAFDANGDLVETSAEVTGNVLTVHVAHAGHGFTYPIVLDPAFRIVAGTLDRAALAAWSPSTSLRSEIALALPALPGQCKAYVSSTLQQQFGGLRLQFGGSMDPRDCRIAPARPIAFTLIVCLQKQDAQGRWPSGRGGPCVTGVGPGVRIAPSRTSPCERYGRYRLWSSANVVAETPEGKPAVVTPQIGPVRGSEHRCLPVPQVRWAHIFAPDGTGVRPSGWHWRECADGGLCKDPAGVTVTVCKEDAVPTGVYGCRWHYDGFTRTKYSTFFPKGFTQNDVKQLVLFSYMNARFESGGRWFGPVLQGGWRVRGLLVNGQPDVVATAFPNRYLDPGAHPITFAVLGCGTSGGVDLEGGPANDNFSAAQRLAGAIGSVTGTLAGATAQPGEDGGVPTRSVWYCWTAPDAGDAVFDTEGSPPPFGGDPTGATEAAPVVSVWAGDVFDALGRLTSGLANAGGGYSVAQFFAQKDATYLVSVANLPGRTPDAGMFVLNWHPCACF
jgi:hypothetical protein